MSVSATIVGQLRSKSNLLLWEIALFLVLYCPTLDIKKENSMNELFDSLTGERLYLNAEERKAFLEKAKAQENNIKYFSLDKVRLMITLRSGGIKI